ncbi:uncharacterized protein TNCV_2008351 [Trichonephila clavipes]|nr:uncharacterized protein TNCV_2008351 [Trichonephila clavipes]
MCQPDSPSQLETAHKVNEKGFDCTQNLLISIAVMAEKTALFMYNSESTSAKQTTFFSKKRVCIFSKKWVCSDLFSPRKSQPTKDRIKSPKQLAIPFHPSRPTRVLRVPIRLLQCLAIITEALSLVMLPEKKKPMAVFIVVLLQLIVNLQTWRSRDYLHAFFGEIGIFVPVGMVILSASTANHAFFTAREALQSLPWKIPQYRDKLKEMIRSECMRGVSLTLWKVYKIERSLIFSAMGTLVTYGMLMATLGGFQ